MDCTPSCCWHVVGSLMPAPPREHGPFLPARPASVGVAFVCCKCGFYTDTVGRVVQEESIEFHSGATPTSKLKEKFNESTHQR